MEIVHWVKAISGWIVCILPYGRTTFCWGERLYGGNFPEGNFHLTMILSKNSIIFIVFIYFRFASDFFATCNTMHLLSRIFGGFMVFGFPIHVKKRCSL